MEFVHIESNLGTLVTKLIYFIEIIQPLVKKSSQRR